MHGIYFSDVFDIAPSLIEEYGAFNISLVNDLPLFVDPFLLFHSDAPEHRALHDQILTYLRFLRDISGKGNVNEGLLKSWFAFPEVKQNWLGYSKSGNRGSGLGIDFARALQGNLGHVFSNFGAEEITRSSHLEKLCLVREGVGGDRISDFVTNLIKEYLLRYTETFARLHLKPSQCKSATVPRVRFNFDTRTWASAPFYLPHHNSDYVILTPQALLTRDNTWINAPDMHKQFDDVIQSVPNDQLRAELNQYILQQLPKDPDNKDYLRAEKQAILKYPELIDYFIRLKEDTGDEAQKSSKAQVDEVSRLFVTQVSWFIQKVHKESSFYRIAPINYDTTIARVLCIKDVIENRSGHRVLYINKQPIRREQDLHLIYRLTWLATPDDHGITIGGSTPEVANKISVVFKLAGSSGLYRSLEKFSTILRAEGESKSTIHVVVYFTDAEEARLRATINELNLTKAANLVLIDAGGAISESMDLNQGGGSSAPSSDDFAVSRTDQIKSGCHLSESAVLELYHATVALQLSREALLSAISPAIISQLPTDSASGPQILSDLNQLNRINALSDGSVPIESWLANAKAMSTMRDENFIFDRHLSSLQKRLSNG